MLPRINVGDFVPRGFEVEGRGTVVSTGRADSTLTEWSKRSFARSICAEHLRYILGTVVADPSFKAVERLEFIHLLSLPEWLDNPAAAVEAIDSQLAGYRTAITAAAQTGAPVDVVTPKAGAYPALLRASDVFVKYHAALLRMKLIAVPEPTLFETAGA